MNPYYLFTLSFAHSDSTLAALPAISMPPNVVPVIPVVGQGIIVPDGTGGLYPGVVQSLNFYYQQAQTIITVTIAPVVPPATKGE